MHTAPPAPPVHIESNGYVLRSLTPGDVTPRFLQWLNNRDMLEGLNIPPLTFDMEQLRRFVASFDNRHNYLIGIFDRSNGLLVGFYTIDANLAHRNGNITTGIGEPDYVGRKVLWLTIDALLDHFYTYRGLEKVTARVLAKNLGMLFNFINATRFVYEARLRHECLATSGERLDLMLFASYKTQPPDTPLPPGARPRA